MSEYTFHTRFTATPIEPLNRSLQESIQLAEAKYGPSVSRFARNIGNDPQLFMITWRDEGETGPAEVFSIEGIKLRMNRSGRVETAEDNRVVGDCFLLIPGGSGKKGRAIIGFTA